MHSDKAEGISIPPQKLYSRAYTILQTITTTHTPTIHLLRKPQSRLSAFFRFSAPVDPEVAAERLTALVAGVGAGPIPPIVPVPPTLAFAVPSGEGDVSRSLLSLSLDKEVADVDVGTLFAGEDCKG